MASKVLNFINFSKIFEGGNAIKSSQRIKESEFEATMDSIKDVLFPILGIDPSSYGKEYMVIGSIGKKKDPEETSGDLDIGYNSEWFSKKEGITIKECSKKIEEMVKEKLPEELGYPVEIKNMPWLNIISIGWPIEGNPDKGTVQVDLIPVSDMKWAEFIYYSPNFKTGESKYKSAHRNWLFSAILSSMKKVIERDDAGEVLDYDSPVLMLGDGLYWNKKSFRGKLKPRLKNPQKIQGSERFVTRDPKEFVEFVLGEGHSPEDVKTFEDVFKIITSPDFHLKEKLPQIKERYIEYLTKVGLPIPSEINQID